MQNIKKNTEQSKKFYDSLLKKIPSHNHVFNVLMQGTSEDDALKYRIYKEICVNTGCKVETLLEKFELEQEKLIELLLELQKVDGWISCIPSNDTEDQLSYKCYKKLGRR